MLLHPESKRRGSRLQTSERCTICTFGDYLCFCTNCNGCYSWSLNAMSSGEAVQCCITLNVNCCMKLSGSCPYKRTLSTYSLCYILWVIGYIPAHERTSSILTAMCSLCAVGHCLLVVCWMTVLCRLFVFYIKIYCASQLACSCLCGLQFGWFMHLCLLIAWLIDDPWNCQVHYECPTMNNSSCMRNCTDLPSLHSYNLLPKQFANVVYCQNLHIIVCTTVLT